MEGFKILQGKQIAPNEPSINPALRGERGQLGSTARKIGQTGASIASALVGAPADIAGGVLGLANYATGGATPTYGQIQEKLPVSLPTSEQVRGGINKLTGGFTTAETPGEQVWDNIVNTATNLLVPFPTPGKLKAGVEAAKGLSKASAIAGAKNVGKALAIAGAGEAAGRGAETLGAGKGGQALAKLGTMGLASLYGGRKALTNRMKEGYRLSEEAAQGKTLSSDTILPTLEKIEQKLPSDYPAKQFIDERIKSIRALAQKESSILGPTGKKIVKTDVPVSEIVSLKQGLNEFFTDPGIPHRADKRLGQLLESLKKPLDEFGKQNKQFGQYWNASEDIFSGLKNQSRATEFLRRNVNIGNLKNIGVQAVLATLGGYVGNVPGIILPIGASFGAKHASQFLDFISKSKKAREYYSDMLKSAAKGSAASASRNLHNLDRIAQKENFSLEPDGFTIVSGRKIKS